MLNQPLVSVIIPFFEGIDWLMEAVDSVLNQTYKNYEIFVINDGSSENDEEFTREYSGKVSYIVKENGGPATARNLGIDCAKGKYIAFLDSDDIWVPDKLEKQIMLMEQEDLAWCHGGYDFFGCEKSGNEPLDGYEGDIYNLVLISCPLATPCVVIRSEVLKEDISLRFNNKMRYGQDYFLWVNMSHKYKIGMVKDTIAHVRVRGFNASWRARVQIRVRAAIWTFLSTDFDNRVKGSMSISARIASRVCVFGTSILYYLESITKNERVLELVSRIFYVLPWLIYKYNKKMLLKKRICQEM